MRLSTNLLGPVAFVTVWQAVLVIAPLASIDSFAGGALAQSAVENAAAPVAVAKSKKQKTRKKGNDFEGTRDLNIFQVEPSVINERYYTSGQAEHSQKISPTLPPGAPIPDNEGPYAPDAKPQTTGSNDVMNEKLDGQVKASLIALKNVKGDSPVLKLKLRVSTINDALLSQFKELKVDVVSSSRSTGDMIVYAPAQRVNEIGNLNQVQVVMLAQ